MLYTTLKKIKLHNPCPEGWAKLMRSLGKTEVDDEPLSLLAILESNGLDDALWALRAVDGYDVEKRMLACDYAERLLSRYEDRYPNDLRPRNAIETARKYARGEATAEELDAAARAAESAAWAAESAAARAAESAAWAAESAATESAAWAEAEAAETESAARAAAEAAERAAERAWADERAWQEQHFRKWLNETI